MPADQTQVLAQQLGARLRDARKAMRAVVDTMQRIEAHAAYVEAIAQARPVRILKKQQPPADGQRRGRGRPRGARNGIVLLASPAEIERLRAELQP